MSDPGNSNAVRARLRDLGQYLINLSEDAEERESRHTPAFFETHSRQVDDLPGLAQLALSEYENRMRRFAHLDADLFAEPAWDILLDLFVAKVAGNRISVSSACIASQVPSTTALRWLGVLENKNLISRQDDSSDKRRCWVELTERGVRAMASLLRERRRHNPPRLELPLDWTLGGK